MKRKFKLSPNEKFLYWTYPILVMISSIFVLLKSDFKDSSEISPKSKMMKIVLQAIFFLFFIASIFMMRKIIGFQKFTEIKSTLPIKKKVIIVQKVSQNFNWYKNISDEINEFNFFQNKSFFQYKCRISIVVETSSFYVNVQDFYQYLPYDF